MNEFLFPARGGKVLALLMGSLLLHPQVLWACTACYGESDSPLAQGMNWGIFSLLAVVVSVLGSIASFFVYLGKRSASAPAAEQRATASEPKQDV